jgi:hypothetical protein
MKFAIGEYNGMAKPNRRAESQIRLFVTPQAQFSPPTQSGGRLTNYSLATLDVGFNTASPRGKGNTLLYRARILSALKEDLRYIYSRHMPSGSPGSTLAQALAVSCSARCNA